MDIDSLDGSIKSIVIRGSNPELLFVEQLVSFPEYLDVLQKGLRNANLKFPMFFRQNISIIDSYISNKWGCSHSSFKVKRLDQFTSEYIVDGCSIIHSKSRGPFSRTSLSIAKYVIITSNGEFGFNQPTPAKSKEPERNNSRIEFIPEPFDVAWSAGETLRCYKPESKSIFSFGRAGATGCGVGAYRISETDYQKLR